MVTITTEDGCRDRQYSLLSRFWELEAGGSCGPLGFRGYRPLSVGLGVAAQEPETATSPALDHTGVDRPYQAQDMRIGLSLRTKLAQGLLTRRRPGREGRPLVRLLAGLDLAGVQRTICRARSAPPTTSPRSCTATRLDL